MLLTRAGRDIVRMLKISDGGASFDESQHWIKFFDNYWYSGIQEIDLVMFIHVYSGDIRVAVMSIEILI